METVTREWVVTYHKQTFQSRPFEVVGCVPTPNEPHDVNQSSERGVIISRLHCIHMTN